MRGGQRLPGSRQGGGGSGTRLLDVRWLASTAGHPRIAIVVPKYDFNAVRRNTLKRRLRELARLHLLPAPYSCDVIIRAKREAYAASFPQLAGAVTAITGVLADAARTD